MTSRTARREQRSSTSPPGVTSDCHRCGTSVLATPAGRLLSPQPTRLGLWDPENGERLHPRDVIARVRSTGLAGTRSTSARPSRGRCSRRAL
jgi:hypothetical protein